VYRNTPINGWSDFGGSTADFNATNVMWQIFERGSS
jgi:hypothetical protein